MTKFNCGCRMSDIINLNNGDFKKPSWNYLLKTFVNVCGKRSKKQMKFQYMENKSMEMEKQRMDMFMNYEDEGEDNFYEECKEQFRQMTKRLKDILDLKE